MGSEKRRTPRKPIRHNVWVQIEKGQPLLCAMSDISNTGARLDVDEVALLPDHFILLLTESGQPRRVCTVVWRTENQVGVRFEKPGEARSAFGA
jgi:hypothetical protein